MSALDRVVVQMLPLVPRGVVERVSARYIAGGELEQALQRVAELNGAGFRATVDVLGEFVADLPAADAAVREYLDMLDAFTARRLESQASVKLTQLGLKLDRTACERNIRRLVAHAKTRGSMVTIDMEDSSCTDETLAIFAALRREGHGVGAVLQACLRRSGADLERIRPLEPNVRICKGIYVESEQVAYRHRDEIRGNFVRLVDCMLANPSFVGIATHDERLVGECIELLRKHRASTERYEFQMLLGVREDMRRRLLASGHPVRIYVPYGADWYAYSLRRLKENPSIAGHVFRSLMTRN